jgi:hypothetical protein
MVVAYKQLDWDNADGAQATWSIPEHSNNLTPHSFCNKHGGWTGPPIDVSSGAPVQSRSACAAHMPRREFSPVALRRLRQRRWLPLCAKRCSPFAKRCSPFAAWTDPAYPKVDHVTGKLITQRKTDPPPETCDAAEAGN